MYSLKNKVVFITGASAGIGHACAGAFAAQGARLLLAARRADRLEKRAGELEAAFGTASHVFALDVRDRKAVDMALAGLPEAWRDIEVLVNNAGLSRGLDKLQGGLVEDWEEMIDTNVKGLLYVSRAVLPGMVARGRGHVINIGSIAGREVYPGGNVYCATKWAVTALTKGMRLDLNGTGVRVTTVDPGLTETEFSLVRFHGDAGKAAKTYQGFAPLLAEDIADAIVYAATRPLHVDVAEMLVLPTAQASTFLISKKP
jgi:3-hydroxy acid dehydrogenase / malonic semialdehyde reductase